MQRRDRQVLLNFALVAGTIFSAAGCIESEENYYKPPTGTSMVVFGVEDAPIETIIISIFDEKYKLLTILAGGENIVYLDPLNPEHYYVDFVNEEGKRPFEYDGQYPSEDPWLFTPKTDGATLRVYNVESPGETPPFWMEVCPPYGNACI